MRQFFIKTAMRLATALIGASVLTGISAYNTPSVAADIPDSPIMKAPNEALPSEGSWAFRFTPYAWLTALNGSTTTKGRTTDIDASFIDILEKSETIVALMGYFEARNGPVSLFGDVVYQKLGLGSDTVRSRSGALGAVGTLGLSLGLDIKMLTMEAGAAYEVFRWPGQSNSFGAIDIMVGGRYWWQQANLDLSLSGMLNVDGLVVAGNRAIAKSGSVSWLDPFVGARFRYQVAPGKELTFSGDIGGFGVGSQFSWQLVGAYTWEFSVSKNVAWYGVVGYRALYVDYSQGAGLDQYQYKMLQHGPLLGVSMRF
jgi:hypothetical protein